MLRVLVKRPGEDPKVEEYSGKPDGYLRFLQGLVGGYIEYSPIGGNVDAVLDEEGLMKDLPDNCGFAGTIVFVQTTKNGGTRSMSEENIRKAKLWCGLRSSAKPDREPNIGVIFGEANLQKHYEMLSMDHAQRNEIWRKL